MVPSVLLDASCLADARRTAGIGRYASELIAALRELPEVAIDPVQPPAPPHESWLVRYAWTQPFLLARAWRIHPELVHGLAGECPLAAPPARSVVTLHDVFPWTDTRTRDPLTAALLRRQAARLRRCAAVIAVSQATASAATEALGLRGERVHVIPEGVTAAFRPGAAALPATLALRPGGYLAWAGSMRAHDGRKGLDALLNAALQTAPAMPLVLAGGTGAESARLQVVARARGLDLRLPGFLPDDQLASVYENAAAVVYPSLREGFGLPALEAMASGGLLVATRTGAIPDFAEGAAILVPPNDPEALRGGLARALAGGAAVDRLRRAAAPRAATYTWARTARLTAELYLHLMAENGQKATSPH